MIHLEINWQDPTVVAAIIGGLTTLLSTVVAATCAALIGKQITGRKRLLRKLHTAINDIAFLLAVEEEHCMANQAGGGESDKQRMRGRATKDRNVSWSGQFTPGRAKDLLRETEDDA